MSCRQTGKQADKQAGGMEGTLANQFAFIAILLVSALSFSHFSRTHTHTIIKGKGFASLVQSFFSHLQTKQNKTKQNKTLKI